jgi:hypothetical protein
LKRNGGVEAIGENAGVDLVAVTFGLSLAGYALLTARLAGLVAPTHKALGVERWCLRRARAPGV